MFICSLSFKWENNIETVLTWYSRLKAKLKFQIIWSTLASLQNKLHCRQISEMLPFLSSSVRVLWRAVLPVQSTNGVCGRHAAPSSRLAGTCLERYTCHSPSYERSSELQPWIISSRSKKSFFFSHYLYRTNHQVLVTISTLAVEKAKRWNTVAVSLCLSEESLQNWAQNLILKEELMWAVRQKESQGGRIWKELWVGVSLSNCKPAHKCVDTHHALVKTWLPVILLCCSGCVLKIVYIQTGLLQF